jgi:geranylgeranyl pyrophosphate synthase
MHGIEEAKAAAARAHASACKALDKLNHDTSTLKSIADYILNRTK